MDMKKMIETIEATKATEEEYSIWVIKTGTADLKTFFLGIGLFVIGLILYPVLMKNSQKMN